MDEIAKAITDNANHLGQLAMRIRTHQGVGSDLDERTIMRALVDLNMMHTLLTAALTQVSDLKAALDNISAKLLEAKRLIQSSNNEDLVNEAKHLGLYA